MSTVKVKHYRDIERKLITCQADLPDFSKLSREAEAEWWETHDIAENLLDSGPDVDAAVYRALGIPDPAKRKKNT